MRATALPSLVRASVVLAILSLVGCRSCEVDLYPLYRAGPVDDEGSWEWEAIGPIVYGKSYRPTEREAKRDRPHEAVPPYPWAEARDEWGIRPLFAHRRRTDGVRTTEVLWPLGRFHREGHEWSNRFTPVFYDWGNDDDGGNERPKTARRSTFVFPFFLRRRGAPGDGFAIFPVYGQFVNFFGLDRFSFILFPLFVKTGRGDMTSYQFIWPFFGGGSGSKGSWLRIFPFYARSDRSGDRKHRGVAWPFVNWWSDFQSSDRPREGFTLWPFYGAWERETADGRDRAAGWSVLYPLFSAEEDRRRGTGQYNAPYPFHQVWWTPDTRGWRIWPFYGSFVAAPKKDGSYEDSRFYLWPFFWNRDWDTGRATHEQFQFIPLYSQHAWENRRGETAANGWLWPLADWSRMEDESGKFAVLSPWLYRILNDPWHERLGVLTSPFVQFRTAERTREHSILGMYRRYEAPGFRRVAIPFLYAYRGGKDGSLHQFLFSALRVGYRADGSTSLRILGIRLK